MLCLVASAISSSAAWLSAGARVRRALGLHCHRGQLLPQLVVQLARDARTLLLLGGQRPANATAPLLLEAIEHAVERLGEGRHLRV